MNKGTLLFTLFAFFCGIGLGVHAQEDTQSCDALEAECLASANFDDFDTEAAIDWAVDEWKETVCEANYQECRISSDLRFIPLGCRARWRWWCKGVGAWFYRKKLEFAFEETAEIVERYCDHLHDACIEALEQEE